MPTCESVCMHIFDGARSCWQPHACRDTLSMCAVWSTAATNYDWTPTLWHTALISMQYLMLMLHTIVSRKHLPANSSVTFGHFINSKKESYSIINRNGITKPLKNCIISGTTATNQHIELSALKRFHHFLWWRKICMILWNVGLHEKFNLRLLKIKLR